MGCCFVFSFGLFCVLFFLCVCVCFVFAVDCFRLRSSEIVIFNRTFYSEFILRKSFSFEMNCHMPWEQNQSTLYDCFLHQKVWPISLAGPKSSVILSSIGFVEI